MIRQLMERNASSPDTHQAQTYSLHKEDEDILVQTLYVKLPCITNLRWKARFVVKYVVK